MLNNPYTKEYIELLVTSFNNRTLSKNEWTHESHLIVAVCFLSTYDFFEAVCRLKSGIILLNNSHLTQNTSNGGYHETLTIFWSKVISTYIKLSGETPIEHLVNNFLNSSLADRQLPFKFYEKEKLLSTDYRTIYNMEDKRTIDELTIKSILTE
jgi:hypothetical protein